MKRIFIITGLVLFALVNVVFPQTDSLNIYWDANTEPDMFQYKLYASVNNLSSFEVIQTISHPYTHTVHKNDVQPGNLYAYTLVAVDSAGNNSDFSDTVWVGIPVIHWEQSGFASGQSTTLPLGEVTSDPDDEVTNLSVFTSNETNVKVSRVGDELVISPDPLNYTGPASFKLKVQDDENLWDQKTVEINFSPLTGLESRSGTPATFEVHQNYPNPFNPTTEIRYSIPQNGYVQVAIYNSLGQEVKNLVNSNQSAGYYTVQWDGTNEQGQLVSSGNYFYIVKAGQNIETRRMVLLK